MLVASLEVGRPLIYDAFNFFEYNFDISCYLHLICHLICHFPCIYISHRQATFVTYLIISPEPERIYAIFFFFLLIPLCRGFYLSRGRFVISTVFTQVINREGIKAILPIVNATLRAMYTTTTRRRPRHRLRIASLCLASAKTPTAVCQYAPLAVESFDRSQTNRKIGSRDI